MDCPYCAESVRDEAIVCRHCARDLGAARPVMLEVEEAAVEIERLRSELDGINARLRLIRHPFRTVLTFALNYLLVPVVLLVAAHILITIALDAKPLYLRIASLLIPLPFGLMLQLLHKVGARGALLIGLLAGAISVGCMLVVTGVNDAVPILPQSWLEGREVAEYIASITLAFVAGNLLGVVIQPPASPRRGGQLNFLATRLARLFGGYVSEDQFRRRVRVIQKFILAAAPLAGVIATGAGSAYTGLKSIFGW